MTVASDSRTIGAVAAEVPRLARVLADAFADNPVSDWLFDGQQDSFHPIFFQTFLQWAIAEGRVDQSDDGTAAAVWIDNTKPPTPATATWHTRIAKATGRHAARWRTLDKLTTDAHPPHPHWWLAFLGVLPTSRGRGHGSQLLHAARVWQQDTPAYLEATSRRLTGFYTRHGYQPAGTVVVPAGPVLYRMWKTTSQPRQQAETALPRRLSRVPIQER